MYRVALIFLSHSANHLADSAMIAGCVLDQISSRLGIASLFLLSAFLVIALTRDTKRDLAKDSKDDMPTDSADEPSRAGAAYPPSDWNPAEGSGYSYPDDSRSQGSIPTTYDSNPVNNWNRDYSPNLQARLNNDKGFAERFAELTPDEQALISQNMSGIGQFGFRHGIGQWINDGFNTPMG